jgi:hypothetical protein
VARNAPFKPWRIWPTGWAKVSGGSENTKNPMRSLNPMVNQHFLGIWASLLEYIRIYIWYCTPFSNTAKRCFVEVSQPLNNWWWIVYQTSPAGDRNPALDQPKKMALLVVASVPADLLDCSRKPSFYQTDFFLGSLDIPRPFLGCQVAILGSNSDD